MLAELAVANMAFKTIRTFLVNGKELSDVGSDVLEKYFGAEKAIAKAAAGGKSGALEAWQAKEALVRQEADLKYLLNQSRLQGYADFVAFRLQYTRDLREAEKEAGRKRYLKQKELEANLVLAMKVGGTLVIIMGMLFGVALYLRN